MGNNALKALADEIESATEVKAELAAQAVQALSTGMPVETNFELKAADISSTDAIIQTINYALPGWSISVQGTASRINGHWVCTLRASGVLDNDAFIGIGRGPVLSFALLGALLKTIAQSPAT